MAFTGTGGMPKILISSFRTEFSSFSELQEKSVITFNVGDMFLRERDRDETETFVLTVETRPRQDADTSRDRDVETETTSSCHVRGRPLTENTQDYFTGGSVEFSNTRSRPKQFLLHAFATFLTEE